MYLQYKDTKQKRQKVSPWWYNLKDKYSILKQYDSGIID